RTNGPHLPPLINGLTLKPPTDGPRRAARRPARNVVVELAGNLPVTWPVPRVARLRRIPAEPTGVHRHGRGIRRGERTRLGRRRLSGRHGRSCRGQLRP